MKVNLRSHFKEQKNVGYNLERLRKRIIGAYTDILICCGSNFHQATDTSFNVLKEHSPYTQLLYIISFCVDKRDNVLKLKTCGIMPKGV